MADPVEITADGYADLRAHVVETWKYLELHDASSGVLLTRLVVGTDPRVNWTVSTGQTLEITATLKGDDADIAAHGLPMTFGGAQLFKVSTGGGGMTPAQPFTQFIMADPSDTLTIKHQVQIPEVI